MYVTKYMYLGTYVPIAMIRNTTLPSSSHVSLEQYPCAQLHHNDPVHHETSFHPPAYNPQTTTSTTTSLHRARFEEDHTFKPRKYTQSVKLITSISASLPTSAAILHIQRYTAVKLKS